MNLRWSFKNQLSVTSLQTGQRFFSCGNKASQFRAVLLQDELHFCGAVRRPVCRLVLQEDPKAGQFSAGPAKMADRWQPASHLQQAEQPSTRAEGAVQEVRAPRGLLRRVDAYSTRR